MDHVNHFEILGLKPSFFIEKNELEFAYNQNQMLFFEEEEKQNQINQSYKILKNDFLRIEHFLKINNFSFNDKIKEKKLKEFFELNIEIEELDKTSRHKKLNEIKKGIKSLIKEVENLFYNNKFEELNDKFIEVKYLNRILENNDKS